MASTSKFTVALIKNRWREILIVILAIISYFKLSRKPEIKEVTKIEYVDRIVEKVITVEKEVVKDKKKRTTIQKPDGTKITTDVEESTNIKENNTVTESEKEKKETRVEIKNQTKHSYNMNLDVKMYPETEYSLSLKMRLGELPILIGPSVYVGEAKHFQVGVGLGIQLEI